ARLPAIFLVRETGLFSRRIDRIMEKLSSPSVEELQKLEEELDPEMAFRKTSVRTSMLIGSLLMALSIFHYYTAGFGLLRETTHRGIHMAFVLGLIFLVFSATKKEGAAPHESSFLRPGGVPLFDWIFAV